LVGLGTLPGDATSAATAVSDDGQVVLGYSFAATSETGQLFRWTPSSGMVALGPPPGMASCQLGQMSGDGRVIFGQCLPASDGSPGADGQLFRWTEAGGLEGVPFQAPWTSGRARASSPDGSVMIGELQRGQSGSSAPAVTSLFRWTESTGVVVAAAPTDGASITWAGFDGAGDFIVGDAAPTSTTDAKGLLWSATAGITALDPVAGFDAAATQSVSADGRVVTGVSTSGSLSPVATLWAAPERRPRLVTDLLAAGGVDLQGARLTSARVSRDGSTLTGGAVDAQGRQATWIAALQP